jgi:hypothetical protein
MSVRRALAAEMAAHHGLTTTARAIALGATHDMIRRFVDRGEWVIVYESVYRSAAAPITAEQWLLAAVLMAGCGAVASHRSAAWLWGLLTAPPELHEISVPYARSPERSGIRVHRSTDLLGAPVHERRGIPVTDPARTVLDAAGVMGPVGATLIVDRAIATRVTTLPELQGALERYGRRGRRGAGKLRDVLESRGVTAAMRPPSILESRMARVARMIDAPPPLAEYEVANGRYRLDFAWPDVKVAVEVDGWEFHADHAAWQRGMERDRWLLSDGWAVHHYSWDDIRDHPERVASDVRRLIARRAVVMPH